ncbi:uncharacterized protein LOC111356731 isoform X1 [Spodoptera litura]|uniref:Uncharacterized protein LOC111356731 isoform X1 n=1 Tax=Spodoptera litura TaxID=69820 RepID=A0A9J7IXL0_SPOLT|nr:uncharacterized protein LOC111356731 isoform X1 [Spodoptera litura]
MVHRAVMTEKTCDHARILVQDPKTHMWSGPLAGEDNSLAETWRRKCGCIRTSDKLKTILGSFPNAPPPTPMAKHSFDKTCMYGGVREKHMPLESCCWQGEKKVKPSKSWQVIGELVQLVQLSVTATALALYYLIYCYMQLVYYTLRSALYFHNADGPMKITIGVVTLTSLIIGFNLMLRMERVLGIIY